jgi:hypothetical protein
MRPRNDTSYYAEKVVAVLAANGFVPDGITRAESTRTGSSDNPILGGSGGKVVFSGGRMRFHKPGSVIKATVGKITTCFYEVEDGGSPGWSTNVRTRDLERITRFAKTEVCFRRVDAIARGREQEWLEKNGHLLDTELGPDVAGHAPEDESGHQAPGLK